MFLTKQYRLLVTGTTEWMTKITENIAVIMRLIA